MIIWIDITNTPHVHFFTPIIEHLKKYYHIIITARQFSETIPLLYEKGYNPIIIGEHQGISRIRKVKGMMSRVKALNIAVPVFDVSMSIGGQVTTILSRLRKKPSIVFTDNDISYKKHVYILGSYFVFPEYFDINTVKTPSKRRKVIQYSGFKEQIYLADYQPNMIFLDNLPFKDYYLLRPENLKASYVPRHSKSLVPDLLKLLRNENVLFLPRYPEDCNYCNGYNNIYVPSSVVNGLDACYFSKAVLTGAGTLAREAALLGIPSVSFFPGNKLLSVDKAMVEKGLIYHTHNPTDIMNYLKGASKKNSFREDNHLIQNQVFQILDHIFNRLRND